MPSNSNVVVHVGSTPPCVVSQLRGFSSRRRHWGLPILRPRRCFPVQDLKQVEDRKNGPPSKRVPDCHQVAMPSEAPCLCFTIFTSSICVCLTPHEQHNKSTSSHLPKPWWLEGSASMAALVSCWCLQYSFDTEERAYFLDMFDAQCPTLQPFIWLRTRRFIKSTTQTPLVSSTLDERQQGLSSRSHITMLALQDRIHDERNVNRAITRPCRHVMPPLPVREIAIASALHSLARASICETAVEFREFP